MAISNQLRTTAKQIKNEPTPAGAGQAKFASAASGLTREGVSSAMALKSKKIVNLSLKGVSNF